MVMAVVESEEYFQKPGAVPFKWEVRPGVPKAQFLQQEPEPESKPKPKKPQPCFSRLSPPELTPPPSGSIFEARAGSFRSAPRTRSERWRLDRTMARPEAMSPGCIPAHLKRTESKKMTTLKLRSGGELDYSKDLETLARWSMSSRRSLLPFCESPSSLSSSSSDQSLSLSPQAVSDAEWAAFGLF